MDRIEFCRNGDEIRQSLINFNEQPGNHPDRAINLIRQTIYWVYDSKSNDFGPNKFVAYRDMTFDRYENAIRRHFEGPPFDGARARSDIEGILGPYGYNMPMSGRLIRWTDSLFGKSILDGVSEDKWKFITLR